MICSKKQKKYIHFLWRWTKTKCFGKVLFHQLLTLSKYNCFVMNINKSLWNNFVVECTCKFYYHLCSFCIISYILFQFNQIFKNEQRIILALHWSGSNYYTWKLLTYCIQSMESLIPNDDIEEKNNDHKTNSEIPSSLYRILNLLYSFV